MKNEKLIDKKSKQPIITQKICPFNSKLECKDCRLWGYDYHDSQYRCIFDKILAMSFFESGSQK